MESFPIIHTNVWDAIWAVPFTILGTQIVKKVIHAKKTWIPTLANLIGLCISIFFAHKHNIWSGIFMGLFYGNAAVGVYSSIKTAFISFRNRE